MFFITKSIDVDLYNYKSLLMNSLNVFEIFMCLFRYFYQTILCNVDKKIKKGRFLKIFQLFNPILNFANYPKIFTKLF